MSIFSKDKNIRLYYASDIHGSQKCFNKFINAGKFYSADVIILGGDITGKSVVHIEKSGNGNWKCNFMGSENTFSTSGELESFKKTVQTAGFYPYESSFEEWNELKSDEIAMENIFVQLIRSSLEAWLDFADRKLKDTSIQCFVMPGNDDPLIVSQMLEQSRRIINPENKVVHLDDHLTMVSCGFSNPTPWDSPRECTESTLAEMIDHMMLEVSDPQKCILNAHVPPFNSTLDEAPKLSSTLQVQSSGGVIQTAPVGSTAIMEAIKKYQYVLSLHGHIHEVHAIKRIGRTLSINPGSEYGDGVLHGALLNLSKDRVVNYQLVAG